MAYYLDVSDSSIVDDIIHRKEFAMLANPNKGDSEIIPYYMLADAAKYGNKLRLRSYQQFVKNWMNLDTPYTRLAVIHDMGTGKTISTLSIAMNFIKFYKQIRNEKFFVYIIGFSRPQFERDLLRFTEFGFVSDSERKFITKLKKQANSQNATSADVEKYVSYLSSIRRRFGNRKGNGYFKFLGYGELVNSVFYNPDQLTKMKESDILKGIKDGTVKINLKIVEKFKNCLIICDEIHNTYNSQEKNNYGIGLQVLLNYHGANIRAVFASGTILTNSPKEVVDICNLVSGTNEKMYSRDDFFDRYDNLLPESTDKIEEAFRGKISFLVDTNPALYPSSSYIGEYLPDSQYIKFQRTNMTPIQEKMYRQINSAEQYHENPYLFEIVLPSPKGEVYKSSQMIEIYSASKEWKDEHGFVYENKMLRGKFFEYENIKNYSCKYAKMLELIANTAGEKIFIFHKFVKMSGVHMIAIILQENGIIEYGSQSYDNTRCALCLDRKGNHGNDHEFKSATYVLAFGEMTRKNIVKSIDSYNDVSNLDGSKIMIIIGSLVMRESYDLIACRHEYIMSRPDNIPSLLQIVARGVRGNSHSLLPEDKRNVSIHIFTAKLSGDELSYEEEQWIKKIESYKVIQQIERIIHSLAIDGTINRNIIEKSLVDNDIGYLKYDVAVSSHTDIDYTTFDAYFGATEIREITYIIKRLFMEYSQAWKLCELVDNIKKPPFSMEFDTSMIDDDNIFIAIHAIIYDDSDVFIDVENATVQDILFNSVDKRIILYGNIQAVIKMIGDYLIAFPLVDGNVHIGVDNPYRNVNNSCDKYLNISMFMKNLMSKKMYEDTKIEFMEKYGKVPFNDMGKVLGEFNMDFHIKFTEEIIENIYNIWTNQGTKISKVYGEFYFKMLYFYDSNSIIAWMDSVSDQIREMYDFTRNISENKMLPDKVDESARGRLTQLTRKLESSGCSWCPSTTLNRFNKAIEKSKTFLTNRENASEDMIPIGHYLEEQPKFFHPQRGWIIVPEPKKKWVENDIVIGFDSRSVNNIFTKFKLRNPSHKIKSQSDARLMERGMLCSSKYKKYLFSLAEKIGIEDIKHNSNTNSICNEIRSRLIFLELTERAKGSDIKYFYNQHEL